MQDFATTINRMGQAVCERRFDDAAACFTEDGVYIDDFYGRFAGRAEIARLFRDYFHRDGQDYLWTFHDPVADGETGYARYLFSWHSKLSGAEGRFAMFEGVSICQLRDGLLVQYSEIAATYTARAALGFPGDRMARVAAREFDRLKRKDEATLHLARAVV